MSEFVRDDEQAAGSLDTLMDVALENRLRELHTCLPGIVVSFDAARQTATVQPAIKRVFTELGAVNLPVCMDVPVCFPGGGGFWLTFPVVAGDECLLVFAERCIDRWHAEGGTQLPAEYRLHDLSDAFALVGVTSQPRRLANVQASGAELRTRDRSTFLRLEAGRVVIRGNVVLEGDIQQTGAITSSGDHVAGGTSLRTHRHGQVRSGPDTSGAPV